MNIVARRDPERQARITAVHRLDGVRAGSALLRSNGRLLAVQDDAWCVAWVTLPGFRIELQVLQGDGAALPKQQKPDFEAAVKGPDGMIHLLGSGSTPNRCAIVRIDPAGAITEIRNHPALYGRIGAALRPSGRPNIEGAIVMDDRLRLFHRGAGKTPSASVDLPLAVLEGARPEVLASQTFELGRLDDIALHFTAAALWKAGCTMFLATAEDTENAIDDGPVAGSVIGWINEEGNGRQGPARASWARLLEPDGQPSRRKAEGLVVEDDGKAAWILTDPDDSHAPAELCRVLLEPLN